MTGNDHQTLAELSRQAKRLRMRALRPVKTYFAGSYASAFHGRGMDFRDFAPYVPGDEVRRIDWQVSARRQEPYVRRHVEERQLRVVIAMDVSASMDGNGPGPTGRERACAVAATLALSAACSGDLAAGLFFADEVVTVMPPRRGEKHALALLRRALEATPASRRTDLRPVLGHLRNLRGHAVVALLSDFLTDPALWRPDVRRLLLRCAGKHDLLAVILADADQEGAADPLILEAIDAESGRPFFVDQYRGSPPSVARLRLRHARLVQQTLAASGARTVLLRPGDDHLARLRGAFRARRPR